MTLLDRANTIVKEITIISTAIDEANWVKTGKHISSDDFLPEIVAAVIYILDKLENVEK